MTTPSAHFRCGFVAGLILLTCFIAPAVSPESVPFTRTWQFEEGLPNNDVHSIAQTEDGFLWLATPVGLVRFDGMLFEEIPSASFINPPNRGVMAVIRSRDGGLWLQMDRGAVVHLNGAESRVFTTADGLPDVMAQAMAEDDNGTLWIAHLGGAVSSLRNGKVAIWTRERGELPWGYMSSVAKDREHIWLARGGHVGIISNGLFRTVIKTGILATRIAPARAGGVWVCAGLQLMHCDEAGSVNKRGELVVERSGVEPAVLFEDSRGAVWIGTSFDGLFRYNGSRFDKVRTSHPEILSLSEDREGNVWVGTHGGGLNRLRPRVVHLETVETGLPSEAVQSVAEDGSGAIWVVTANGLVARRTGEAGWTTMSTNSDWPSGGATAVLANPRGGVWVGLRNRRLLFWENGKVFVWSRNEGVEANPILTLLASREGDLWIGGLNQMVQRFRRGEWRTFRLPENTRVIRATAEDAAGNVWFGSSRGLLFRASGDEIVDETALLGGAFRAIRCLHATPDGSLWIGFAGWGVGRLKSGKFALISTEQGLFDKYVSQIVADGHGWMWFGSDHGLFKVEKKELDAVAEGKANRVRSIYYGRGEGLPSLQADFGCAPGAMLGSDGRVWIPTRSALAVLDPEAEDENLEQPQVLLKRMIVDDQTVVEYGGALPVTNVPSMKARRSVLRVEPGHRKVQIDFTALSFSAPENVRFQYRLSGLDDRWIETGNERSVSYSRLPAGNYQFELKACNSSGVWNDTGAMLAFTVMPFVWQTWWFQAGTLALFCACVIVVVRYVSFRRLRLQLQTLEKEAALHKERTRIARDLHDDLGSRLTKLVLLSDLLHDGGSDREEAANSAKQISTTTRQVIKALDETVWAVNPRNDTLPHLINYIGQSTVEFLRTAGIRCHADLPVHPPERLVSAEVRHNLFLVVKEALNNVVRHASATDVWLRVNATGDGLAIVVEDNGHGLANTPDDTLADGLRNMRQRAEEIGGEFQIESRAGGGTRVSVNAPWSRHEQ